MQRSVGSLVSLFATSLVLGSPVAVGLDRPDGVGPTQVAPAGPIRPRIAPSTPSMLQRIDDASDAISIEVGLDPTRLSTAWDLASADRPIHLTNLPVPGDVAIDLELVALPSVFDDATLLAVDGRGRERPLDVPSVQAFSGRVIGDADSDVFLCFSPAGVEGWIHTEGVALGVSDGTKGGPIRIHRLDALPPLDPKLLENFCGTDLLEHPPRAEGPEIDGGVERRNAAGGGSTEPCRLIRLAIETDEEFLALFDGDEEAAVSYVATLVAGSSMIYTRDFGIRLQVSYLRLWNGGFGDPWSAPNMQEELPFFREYWNENMGHVGRDLAHFLSGRPLGGGVAWLPGLCGSYAYGLSANLAGSFPYPMENNSAQNWDVMVFNHELGHNVGCPHTHDIGVDNCAGGDCSVVPNATIMSYCHGCPGGLANIRLEFCPENQVLVAETFDSLSCDYTVTDDTAARDDEGFLVAPGDSLIIDVLANDAAPDCGEVDLDGHDAFSAQGGTVETVPGGGVLGRTALRYTAPTDAAGFDEFTYLVGTEDRSRIDDATVTIRIDAPLPPVDPIGTKPGVLGRYYALEPLSQLPDFDLLTPYDERVWTRIESPSTNGEFADTGRADQVGVVWEGWIEVPESGSWTFGVESDDGSKLWIGEALIVENDFLHGMVDQTGQIGLLAGKHPIRIEFFENGGGAGCIVRWSGPQVSYEIIPDDAWSFGGTLGDPADLDGDGWVDGVDLGLMFAGWGQPGPTDLNGDGTTDGEDFGLLLLAWNPAP